MKKIVKSIYIIIEKMFFNLFFIKQEFRFMGMNTYIIYSLFQKIFRINSQVPWPVHCSSVVSGYKNITYKKEITPLGYSPNSYIQATNGIIVGSNVIHAVGLTIITSNHEINDYTKHTKNHPVIIGDNCWLGANVTILPGVELGNHIIVAAGSVVSKSFLEANCIIGGVPAKVIKKIENYNGKHYFLDCYVKNNEIITLRNN
jgi:acetyltransferase-like isoleucine patch superfamily enzyme